MGKNKKKKGEKLDAKKIHCYWMDGMELGPEAIRKKKGKRKKERKRTLMRKLNSFE